MNFYAALFLLVEIVALMSLPRRFASLPLLAGACYMTLGQGISVGPFHLPIMRMLIMAGIIRVMARRERPVGGRNRLDTLIMIWAASALTSSAFHKTPVDALVFRLGIVYNSLGIYFLIRTFCQSMADVMLLVKITAFVLVPVALEMLNEQRTGRNLFAIFGGVPDAVVVRNDRLRAQGPFSHGILAGTVGALCLPLMCGLWRQHPRAAKVGIAACMVMVVTCNSSGPLISFMFSVLALTLWRWRQYTRQMRIAAVVGYILLELVMKAPAYYLIARVDLTGGSTGYHRAALIESSLTHLNEWWFAGTDYTRHWMPYGVSWSEDHCDITNQYLAYGVLGGLPLMLLFICALVVAFRYVGQALQATTAAPFSERFLIWSFGSALFVHAVTGISVSYFDQSFVFLYMDLAVIGSLKGAMAPAAQPPDAIFSVVRKQE